MLTHVFSALCQSSSFDAVHGTLTMIGVIEKFTGESAIPLAVTTPPVAIPVTFQLVTVLFNEGASDEAGTYRTVLVAPGGQKLVDHQTSFVVQAAKHHRIIGTIAGMPYGGEGVYWFEVSLQKSKSWETVARVPYVLEVKVATPKIAAETPVHAH